MLIRALAKSPDDRYDSCLAFVGALHGVEHVAALPVSTPTELVPQLPVSVAPVEPSARPRVEPPPSRSGPPPAPPPEPPSWALPVYGTGRD